MDKNFIPYDEALELEALGCKEESILVYIKANATGTKHKLVSAAFAKNSDNPLLYPQVDAFLYSQVFRWFRETHNLMGCVQPIYLDETHTDYEFWYFIQGIEEENDEEVFYGTYEEAEYECLKELIKILNIKINGK
jgi:hypothetical protein